ncbi:MAG: STAS domain-containing protein [Treponema sp.]|jgi:anti-sigma B factor antagonist|nr:STAS domain-containing protein [Treponema sp.]
MKLIIGRKNDIFLIEITGKLQLFDSNELKELILKMIKKKIEVFILNMKNVQAVNSSGIGALIYLASTAKKMNLRMAMINVSEGVQKAFEVTKLETYFPILPNLHTAVEMFEKR